MNHALRTIVAVVFVVLFVPASPAATISFSGYDWAVKSGPGLGPGPNNWSESNVSVDSSGRLHLRLTESGGSWYAAEVRSLQSFGFGTYQFQIVGQPHLMDRNVVLGLFNYGPPTAGPDGTNEIDIEFATFGGAQSNHGNWTVYPAVPGPYTTTSYDASANGDTSTHRFTWSSQQVHFQALSGIAAPFEYASSTYAPADYLQRIPQNAMPLHMNLWLFQGHAPQNGQGVEMIISSFSFTPLAAVPEPSTYALMLAGLGFVGYAVHRRRKAAA